jgi:flagellar motor component MotA
VTKILNLLYYFVCLIVALGSELTSDGTLASFIPAKYAHMIMLAVLGAAWIKSHWNLFINPDGTKASYVPMAMKKEGTPQ